MAKKNNDWLIFGIVILVILVMSQLDWTKPYSYNTETTSQFVEKEKADTTLAANLGNPTPSYRQDLCSKIKPYVIIFDLENICTSSGGIWSCDSNRIGCYSLTHPLIDCQLSVVETAITQCREVGAFAGCDELNLWCSY